MTFCSNSGGVTDSVVQIAKQPGSSRVAGFKSDDRTTDAFQSMLQGVSQERNNASSVPAKTNSAAPQRHEVQTAEIARAEPSGLASEALPASSSLTRAEPQSPAPVSLNSVDPVGIQPAAEPKLPKQAEPGVSADEDTDSRKKVGMRSERGRPAGHCNSDLSQDDWQSSQTVPADGTSPGSAVAAYTMAQAQVAPLPVVATAGAVSETGAAVVVRVVQRLENSTKAGPMLPVQVANVVSENDEAAAATTDAVREYPAETDGMAVESSALPKRQNGTSGQVMAIASRSAAVGIHQTEDVPMHNAGKAIATATDGIGPFSTHHECPASAKAAVGSAEASLGKAAGNSLSRRASAQEEGNSTVQSAPAMTTPSSFAVVTADNGSAGGVHAGLELPPGVADSHRESPTNMLTEIRTVETHRSGAPQVEIGIQDPSLGEVRVQAVLSRSGVMHIDVAGRTQAADTMLDQIAPLMHAAVAQQAEAHGQSHTIHVTAAAVPGGDGKAGFGSLTGSGMAGAGQSGSFSSSLGNDGQPQQQQRRLQSLAYATSAVHQEEGETIVRSAFASSSFFNQPHEQSGLSVRI